MTHFFRRFSGIYFYSLPLIIFFCWTVSCKKSTSEDGLLRFSILNDGDSTKYVIDTKLTVSFDTVLTSVGSVTRRFAVHNTSNQEITIKSIFLTGGYSYYSINVNGVSGKPNTPFKDVTISKKDSIFVFVKVNIDPHNQNNPFLITDAIKFVTGTGEQEVKLIAYGQDARYIIADRIIKNEDGNEVFRYKVVAGEHETVTWTKERPYVVYGWAAIDSTGTLIIEPGTKVYFHNKSGLWAYRYSNLKVNGTINEPVLFRGDRLESWFDKDYAQWNGVWINEGVEASIHNATITNASIGIQVTPLLDDVVTITPNIVKIENTIIKNTKEGGVWGSLLNIEMTNCVIANNGEYSLLLEGGQYTMKHVTIANYLERKAAACYVSNVASGYDNALMDIKADFINCIIYGKNETEVGIVKAKEAELEVIFQNCLIKAKENSSYFIDCLRNEDPMFKNIEKHDFMLLPNSPAIGKGKPNIGVPLDILGNPRGDKPDIGAYQN